MINRLINASKLFAIILASTFSISAYSVPSLSEGFDWGLPNYASPSETGGMIGETYDSDPEVPGAILFALWKEIESTEGEYNFERLDKSLLALDGRPTLIRLEVNSKCHAPDWVSVPYSDNQNFQFWKQDDLGQGFLYEEQLKGFVNAFATKYKDKAQVIGVHLGISDGEYYNETDNSCPKIITEENIDDESDTPDNPDQIFGKLIYGGGRDGWGEFWWTTAEETSYEGDGLTPALFESSVIRLIDMYADAFGKGEAAEDDKTAKLAWMSYTPFGTAEYRQSIYNIYEHVNSLNLGHRDGQVESWMRYTGNLYGVDLVTGTNKNDRSCSMTFNEDFADRIQGRYWGDENEFYGEDTFITESVGPLHNQAYRFYMSSMRALQLRKNYVSINLNGHRYLKSLEDLHEFEYTPNADHTDPALQTRFNPKSFITYLSKTLGKTREDTPDAFIVLGQKTINTSSGLYPTEFKNNVQSEDCLTAANERGHTLVSDFGRWLSVVSKTDADPTMIKIMPYSQKRWGQIISADRDVDGVNVSYELYARKAPKIDIDINDQLIEERCSEKCDIQVKVVFKDDRNMGLQVVPSNGIASEVLETNHEITPDGRTRTASFDIADFEGAETGHDFSIRTMNDSDLSILMVRVNFLDEQSNESEAPTVPEVPAAPAGLSPSGDNPEGDVVFSWTHVAEATGYIVSYSNAGSYNPGVEKGSAELGCESGICQQTISLLDDGDSASLAWIRAINSSGNSAWSSTIRFKVIPQVDDSYPPTIISPKDDVTQSDDNATFTWMPVPGALRYQVAYNNASIYTESAFETTTELNCSIEICEYTVSGLKSGLSDWKVRAQTALGESEWSSVSNFIIALPEPPAIATILQPINDVSTGRSVTFTWTHVPEALKYRVSYKNAGSSKTTRYKNTSKLNCSSGVCSLTIRRLKLGDSEWKVRSKNAVGKSDWSIVGNFTVKR